MGRDLLNIFIVRFNAAAVETKESPPRHQASGVQNFDLLLTELGTCAHQEKRCLVETHDS
mgnify:CR=1 FL=1|jgi:hypothetical protein